MSIKIVTDSTCYIPDALAQALDIRIVSLNVILDGQSFREVDLSNDTFYTSMAEAQSFPT
ncbi:MAG: DegV family protein, partial [Cellulosilyticaceae bacterium]